MIEEELLALLGRRPLHMRGAGEVSDLVELVTASIKVYGAGGTDQRRLERLLEASVERVEPSWLRSVVRALYGLPPYRNLASVRERQAKAANLWAEEFDALPDEERLKRWHPQRQPTLRRNSNLKQFAALLARALQGLVDERAGRHESPASADLPGARYRPRLPAAVVITQRIWHWVDDAGRNVRTIYEQDVLATRATNGLHRLIATNTWKGYKRQFVGGRNAEIIHEELLANDMQRIVLRHPPLEAGQEQTTSWEVRTVYDEDAPLPVGGEIFSDLDNDDFEMRVVVYFSGRLPVRAWRFSNLPRMLVPGTPDSSELMGLDSQDRLAHNFSAPTYARTCYGIAWRYEES